MTYLTPFFAQKLKFELPDRSALNFLFEPNILTEVVLALGCSIIETIANLINGCNDSGLS